MVKISILLKSMHKFYFFYKFYNNEIQELMPYGSYYQIIFLMQQSKSFQQIPEFFRECYNANQELRDAITDKLKNIPKSKQCIALIGKTGVGKSCLFEYLLGQQLKQTKFIKGGVFHLEIEQKTQEQQKQRISNGAQSGTQLPNIQQMDNDESHLIDLPGFLDNQGETAVFINTLRIYETLKRYQDMIKFICVIKYEDLNFAQRKDCFNITAFVTMLEKVCQKAGYKKDKQLFIVSCLPQDCVGQTKDDIYTELEEQLDEQYNEDPNIFVKIGEDYQYLKNCFQNRQFYFLIPQNKKHPYQPENLEELKGCVNESAFFRNELDTDSLFIDKNSQNFLKVKTKELIDVLKEKQRSLLKIVLIQFETFKSMIEQKYKEKESLSIEEKIKSYMFYQFTKKLDQLKDSTLEFSEQSKQVLALFKQFQDHDKIFEDQTLEDIKILYQVLEDLHLSCVNQNIIQESFDGKELIFQENFIQEIGKWGFKLAEIEDYHVKEAINSLRIANNDIDQCKMKGKHADYFWNSFKKKIDQESRQKHEEGKQEFLNQFRWFNKCPKLSQHLYDQFSELNGQKKDLKKLFDDAQIYQAQVNQLNNQISNIKKDIQKLDNTLRVLDNCKEKLQNTANQDSGQQQEECKVSLKDQLKTLKERLQVLEAIVKECSQLKIVMCGPTADFFLKLENYINHINNHKKGFFVRWWNYKEYTEKAFNSKYNEFIMCFDSVSKNSQFIEETIRKIEQIAQ